MTTGTFTMEPATCGICKNTASKYHCPRCNLEYCSLKCYKSPEHVRCSEGLAKDSFSANLQHERVDEETKHQMLDILKRFSTLDMDENSLDAEKSSLGFLGELTPETVESMNVEELMAMIGPEALKRFEEDLKTNPKYLEEALKEWRPWWLPKSPAHDGKHPNQDKVPEPLEELPPLSKLTCERPPEMLWNNLVELLYLYVYLSRVYAGDRFPNALEFVEEFMKLSHVISSQQFTHASVVYALRAAEAAVALESEIYISDETKIMLLDDILALLANVNYLLAALGDLQRIFEKSVKLQKSNFFAAKKIYFYNVWLNEETTEDAVLVDTIMTSMCALVSGYKERLVNSTHHPGGAKLANLNLPKAKDTFK